ncbi:MAG: HAMP domain-containing protein [Alphaproteobacteria bacterium]|nr:HAMP domain-containing protein [Alphaproteobacteria bacterium]
MRFWPASLGGRTALVLLVGLVLVQVAGLTIHAFDRVDALRLAQIHNVAVRAISIYRSVAVAPVASRAAVVHEIHVRDGIMVRLQEAPPASALPPSVGPLAQQLHANMLLVPIPPADRPREYAFFGGHGAGALLIGMRLPDGPWVNLALPLQSPRWLLSPTFLAAFVLMTAAAALLTLWSVRRLTAPVATLAAAAERLGRDVNAPPLPEDGPTEVATAAAAFNTMAARIRRFLTDRDFMLAAIGHDLRTPITRLKLRAEFIEDEELRRKTLADLDELEAMVSATLAFGRETLAEESSAPVDLAEMLRTVLDEAGDSWPEVSEHLVYDGPDHLTVTARPVALKRAITNLVGNAVKYGAAAHVSLTCPREGVICIAVDDDGPGIPPEESERVFQPFVRLEPSRNRETGGVGLGLTIARDILRAHGGEVRLVTRPGGGIRAAVTLPA